MLFFVFIIELGQISDIYEDVGLHAFCLKRVQRYVFSSTWTNKLSYILVVSIRKVLIHINGILFVDKIQHFRGNHFF